MPELLRLYAAGLTRKELAAHFAVPEGAISGIIKRKGLANRKPTSGRPRDFVPKPKAPRPPRPKPAPKPRKERPKAIPPEVAPEKAKADKRPVAELEAEIKRICDETVASRCPVDSPEWLATVRRCKELRALIGSRKPRGRPRKNRNIPGLMDWNFGGDK
jgi:hypothetical protein